MVAPGATGASFDVLLAFSMDEEANKRVQNRTSTIEQELKRIQENALKAGKAMNQMAVTADQKTEKLQKTITFTGSQFAKLAQQAQESSKKINQGVDSNIKKYKELEETAKRVRQQAGLISGTAARGAAISGQTLLAGVGIAGGIVAEANRFAKEAEDAKKATAATREWTAATKDLASARARVDTVLLREALPLLQEAARVAERAAAFVEKNPEIVQAALKTGVVLAGLGAVGLAVSKGIKLVADIAYIAAVATEFAAAKLHNEAADKELAAAAASKVTNRADDLRRAFGQTPAPSSNASLLGAAGLIVAGLVASGVAVTLLNQLLEKSGINREIDNARQTARNNNARIYPGLINNPEERKLQVELNKAISAGNADEIARLRKEIDNLGNQSEKTADQLQNISLSAADSPEFDNLLKAYEDYKADDLALVQQHYADRQGIVADALNAELAENKKYADSVAKVNQNTSKSLASAAADFEQSNISAEENYQKNRAQIIQDGARDIEQLQKDLQERLAKLAKDHNERTEDLTAARDALGLAKENRRYRDTVRDERRQGQEEIKQRRQEIAQRLADLKQSYEQERAERLADYQARVAEIRTNAAEQLKELAQQHQEELRKIQEQKNARLRELDTQFAEERKRRYSQFVQQLRDLDASLLGETKLRQAYQQKMLTDLDAFLAAYRNGLASLGSGTTSNTTTPITNPTSSAPSSTFAGLFGFSSGGYAHYGIYRLGDEPGGGMGGREFVLSAASTRAAEKIIGGQLNQENLLRALSGIGSNKNISYYDNRRMERAMSRDDKNAFKQVAMDALQEMIGV